MNMKHLSILAILMVAVRCNAQSGGVDTTPHQVQIVESQNGQTITVRKGDDVVVTFVASSGTGYQWTMEPTELFEIQALLLPSTSMYSGMSSVVPSVAVPVVELEATPLISVAVEGTAPVAAVGAVK